MVPSRMLFTPIGFILLTFSFDSGLAIKCFECNSHNDTRCAAEKVAPELEKDCSLMTAPNNAKYTMCRKIIQTIEFEVNGLQPDSRVIRGCGWDDSNYKNKCYQRSGFGGRQEVCSCSTDLCNSSSTLKALSVIFLTLTVLFLNTYIL
uniref:Uncharacterized protein n=1 Tax=Clastoptera arizonana TaxID=38151 RepID=A0A1B6DU84_9HEMI